ncbi:MAG: hypothetical protein ACPGYX_05585 [Oceanobacter sp.]
MLSFVRHSMFLLIMVVMFLLSAVASWAMPPSARLEVSLESGIPFVGQVSGKLDESDSPAALSAAALAKNAFTQDTQDALTQVTLFLRFKKKADTEIADAEALDAQAVVGELRWQGLDSVNLIEGEVYQQLGSMELVFSETRTLQPGDAVGSVSAATGTQYLIYPVLEEGKLVLQGTWVESNGRCGRIRLIEATELVDMKPGFMKTENDSTSVETSRWVF